MKTEKEIRDAIAYMEDIATDHHLYLSDDYALIESTNKAVNQVTRILRWVLGELDEKEA